MKKITCLLYICDEYVPSYVKNNKTRKLFARFISSTRIWFKTLQNVLLLLLGHADEEIRSTINNVLQGRNLIFYRGGDIEDMIHDFEILY